MMFAESVQPGTPVAPPAPAPPGRTEVMDQLREALQAKAEAQKALEAAALEVRTIEGGKVIIIPDGRGGMRRIEMTDDGAITTEQLTESREDPMERSLPGPPDSVIELVSIIGGLVVAALVLTPIARSLARLIDRRSSAPPQQTDVAQRLSAIEQAVDAVAVEVERISEGQRFTSKLLSDRVNERERVR